MNPVFDFRSLSVAERLQLVEDLWESIAEEAPDEALPLTPELAAELDRRLADLAPRRESGGFGEPARAPRAGGRDRRRPARGAGTDRGHPGRSPGPGQGVAGPPLIPAGHPARGGERELRAQFGSRRTGQAIATRSEAWRGIREGRPPSAGPRNAPSDRSRGRARSGPVPPPRLAVRHPASIRRA
jgi:putative addiction module component (TIGR02574 family)